MKAIVCDGCGEQEDYPYRVLKAMSINQGKDEKVYMLCDVCRNKICRIIEGHGL